MRRIPWVVAVAVTLLFMSACDRPTDPLSVADGGMQELAVIAESHGLSHMPMKSTQTIEINGVLYDIGCPMQCMLPEGIFTLLMNMKENGTLRILPGAVPFVYVSGTKTPVFLQNARLVPQCMNGKDDDGDGLIDYPEDPGCTHPEDNSEFNAPPIDIKISPLLRSPSFVLGQVVWPPWNEWFVKCPIRATLLTQDERTWTALKAMLYMEYVKWEPEGGWVMTDEGTMELGSTELGGILSASGWMYRLPIPRHEMEYTLKVLVRGSDGEEVWLWANDGAKIFCGV